MQAFIDGIREYKTIDQLEMMKNLIIKENEPIDLRIVDRKII